MASALKAIREHCVLCVNGKVQKNNLEIIKPASMKNARSGPTEWVSVLPMEHPTAH